MNDLPQTEDAPGAAAPPKKAAAGVVTAAGISGIVVRAPGEVFLGRRITPLTRRRIDNFRANRRGFWSLWIFLALFGTTLFAEFLANDRPLLVSYAGNLYMPVLHDYPETTFGGDFPSETDYQGRDVLARLIYGFRISVLFGLVLTLFSSVVGVAAGAVQGYFGGTVDLGLQRFIEIWDGLPVLYLLIILATFVEPNFWWLLGLMLLFSWTGLVGVVRAEFLRARNFDYIRAARALGVSDPVIITRHVLPNATVATITFLPFILNGSITTLTSLDFLGFGLPPGSASLGELLAQGKANLQAPWLGITAFFVLAVMLSLLIFIGEAVRDAFDPRKVAP